MTFSEIRAQLELEYPVLTEQINGVVRTLTDSERATLLNIWARRKWEDMQPPPEPPPPPPPPVTTISNAQMRLWLVENGHYAAVTGYINNITDPTSRLKAQIEFQSRATVERNHPLVLAVGQILGLNASELDAAFQQASLL